MLRPRIIPCLLIHENGLVKTQRFREPKYIGDPINAVRIFNEKEADELLVLDIDATAKGLAPDFGLIRRLAAECRMPLCYGGGVASVDQVERLVNLGVEKVALSAAAIKTPKIISEMASAVGKQSIVVVLDVRRRGGSSSCDYHVCSHNGIVDYDINPIEFARKLQDYGVGEIAVNSVDCDGMMGGYDIELAKRFRGSLNVPLTFLGGAGAVDHMAELVTEVGNVGCAAGSMFVFKGRLKAVLINYPSYEQKRQIFSKI